MTTNRVHAVRPTDQQIYDRIFTAILERRLRPGAHLREVELADMFGVGRTKVRQALAKLAEVGIVEVERNRGAYVAAPTRRQAGHVFDVRLMLEPQIVAELARSHTHAQIALLRQHIVKEERARAGQDEAKLIRLTGEFHLVLAELFGNPLIDRLLKSLEALTCLSILSYARTGSCACLPNEHRDILHAIAAGDAAGVSTLMTEHLKHVRAEIDLDEAPAKVAGLSEALGFTVPKDLTQLWGGSKGR
jgi:DNA-binding GntR family transcriptional regulator